MHAFYNYPLFAAFISMILAQVIKVPLNLIIERSWNPGLAFSTGGMPSSHSAAASSLAVSVGIVDGFNSSLFAIAAVVCAITMYDAAGIRRHAGIHAALLNRIIEMTKGMTPEAPLKELLGHRPVEVLGGVILGTITSYGLHYLN
ncbi:divergent PAP2 family protein [Paenibacillus glufosinatiresistens]|uniref:divergent PAP2 family protein n=1 Tax=Paenibacillus glufosinatiresistens TaxID=3070657 RepID=UPI00286DF207|nr:divergent PAP2 family protein [Paenibacillus sp. YX.27]